MADLYKPMREAALDCRLNSMHLYTSYTSIHVRANMTRSAIAKFASPNTIVTPQEVEPLLNDFFTLTQKSQEQFANDIKCTHQVEELRLELAAVLDVERELTRLYEKYRTIGYGKIYPFFENTTFAQYIENPEQLMNLIAAVIAGASGDPIRANAAFLRTIKMVEEISDDYKLAAEHQKYQTQLMRDLDGDINSLFLNNLRARFKRTPVDYILSQ
jgi:hypothetical protein